MKYNISQIYMDLRNPNECNIAEQGAFKEFVISLADQDIEKKLENISEKCLRNNDIKSSLKPAGLLKLQQIYPGIDKGIKRLESNMKKLKAAAQKIQAANRIKAATTRTRERKRKRAATILQARIRGRQARKTAADAKEKAAADATEKAAADATETQKKTGGKRKSKKQHYKPIIKTKTIRKKMLKRRRTKKRDKINRRRSRK